MAALPNVRIRGEHAVTDLITTPDGGRVTGVLAVAAGDQQVAVHDVDLIVDASGRGSRARHWLAQLGYPEAAEERIETPVTFVTGHFRRTPGQLGGRYGTAVGSHPANPRGGFVTAQENDTWIAGVNGWFGTVPAAGHAGLLAFAERGDYLLRLRAAAADEPVLATAVLRVVHMEDPPAALFAPDVAGRVPRRS